MRPYTTDTQNDAAVVQSNLIRNMPPDERAMKAIRMSTRLARECKDAIRRNHPDFAEEQVAIAFIRINYGADMAQQVATHLTDRHRVS